MHQFEIYNEQNNQPLQAVAEARMPAHLKERLEKSEQLKKVAKSLDEKNKDTIGEQLLQLARSHSGPGKLEENIQGEELWRQVVLRAMS